MQDDGAGIYIAEHLKEDKGKSVFVCGPDVFKIMNSIQDNKRIILIDAIDASLKPGTIICLTEQGLFKFNNLSRSSHQISMLEAIKVMKLTLPEFKDVELFFVGVQIDSVAINEPMTKEVKISVERLVEVFL